MAQCTYITLSFLIRISLFCLLIDEALTKLLENPEFSPRRTLIFAHGFDEEEVGARQGAGRIAPFLEERYGKDGVLLLVDEGTGTVDGLWGSAWALPANAEKGYLDVKVGLSSSHCVNVYTQGLIIFAVDRRGDAWRCESFRDPYWYAKTLTPHAALLRPARAYRNRNHEPNHSID